MNTQYITYILFAVTLIVLILAIENKKSIDGDKKSIAKNTSGTWKVKLDAPTPTGITSLNDGYICNYVRVDDTVSVSGRFDLVTKNAPSVVKLAMSGLPIQAKAIDARAQVDGFVNSTSASSYGLIRFDPLLGGTATVTVPTSITMTLNRVPASDTGSYFFSFTYQV